MLAPLVENATGALKDMHRSIVTVLLLFFLLVSCKEGNVRRDICPDGEPIFVIKNIEDAYPAYVREYAFSLSVTEEILSKAQVSATLKTNAVKLRQELDQERAELEIKQKSVIMALQTTPCDKAARDNAWKVLGDIKTKTTQIPDRLKQLRDDSAARLESEVSNLLRYPDIAKDLTKPSVFEVHLPNKVPRRLFDLLSTYNDEAILSVPNVGSALRDYKRGYYDFRHKVTELHEAIRPRIGELATIHYTPLWPAYFDYAVLRFAHHSQAAIMKAYATNETRPWHDYEQVFIQFSKDESVSKAFSEAFALFATLEADVEKIKLAFSNTSTTSG